LLAEHADDVARLASEARLSGNEYQAPDAAHALAWLLWNRHDAARGGAPIDEDEAEVTVFRGQEAQYKTVEAGARVAGGESPFVDRINWFGVLLRAWLDVKIPPPKSRDGGRATFALSSEERLYAAQHYYEALDIRTPLLDWTFDPIVAFVFAARSAKGRVMINSRRVGIRTYLFLPPLLVSRPWVQKAIHGWNTSYPVTALPSVVFSVNQNERDVIESIYGSERESDG
jgi:hypothetical protein